MESLALKVSLIPILLLVGFILGMNCFYYWMGKRRTKKDVDQKS